MSLKERGRLYLPQTIYRKFTRPTLSLVLPFAFLILPFGFATAQSGRQPPPPPKPQPPPQSQGKRPVSPPPGEQPTQDDKPVKLRAELITVVTSVTDPAGNQVNDLTQKDFALYEDNVPQDISGLYREGQLPLRMIFLFDTSTSIKHRFDFEQRAAARFFRQVMQPGDKAAIMSVASDPKLEVGFTESEDLLANTLALLKPEGATALYDALIAAARYLRPSEGRHVMIVLSDGTDTVSSSTLAKALAEIQMSDAVIYGVHSTGVAPSANVQDLAGEFVLKALCEDTGGRAFFPPIYDDQKRESRDLDEIYRRLAADVRAQFVLTYYSNNERKQGLFRNIRVEVKRPGLQVRSRRGYYSAQ